MMFGAKVDIMALFISVCISLQSMPLRSGTPICKAPANAPTSGTQGALIWAHEAVKSVRNLVKLGPNKLHLLKCSPHVWNGVWTQFRQEQS